MSKDEKNDNTREQFVSPEGFMEAMQNLAPEKVKEINEKIRELDQDFNNWVISQRARGYDYLKAAWIDKDDEQAKKLFEELKKSDKEIDEKFYGTMGLLENEIKQHQKQDAENK